MDANAMMDVWYNYEDMKLEMNISVGLVGVAPLQNKISRAQLHFQVVF